MIDTSKAQWEISKEEKHAIAWLEEHEFSGEIKKQYISKTVFAVSKDGHTDTFDFPQGVKGMKPEGVMEQFEKSWGMYVALCKAQGELGAV